MRTLPNLTTNLSIFLRVTQIGPTSTVRHAFWLRPHSRTRDARKWRALKNDSSEIKYISVSLFVLHSIAQGLDSRLESQQIWLLSPNLSLVFL